MPNRSSWSGPIEARGSVAEQAVEARLRRTERPPTCRACCRSPSSAACCSRHGRRATARTAAGLLPPVARDAVHRSHRQRMIAAHEDRNGAGARQRIGTLAERADPALDRRRRMSAFAGGGALGGSNAGLGSCCRGLRRQSRADRGCGRCPRCAARPAPSRFRVARPRSRWGSPSKAMRGQLRRPDMRRLAMKAS